MKKEFASPSWSLTHHSSWEEVCIPPPSPEFVPCKSYFNLEQWILQTHVSGMFLITDCLPTPMLAPECGQSQGKRHHDAIYLEGLYPSSSYSWLWLGCGLCFIDDPPPPFSNLSGHTHGSKIRGPGQGFSLGNTLFSPFQGNGVQGDHRGVDTPQEALWQPPPCLSPSIRRC